jgi:hypothetical protein
MVRKNLNNIFLSASIPSPERNEKFYNTADIVAIRDSVRALATVVIPKANLIWGGHPAITPLLRFVMEKMDSDLKQHITLYQSNFFKDYFPKDNFHFENIKIVKEELDRESSLIKMREQMFIENSFSAGIFIGGMEGVIEEYELFKKYNPNALILPIGSTGAAAKIIYENIFNKNDDRLLNDYAYMSLFRDYLSEIL